MALELPFLTANSGATFSPTADVLSGFSPGGLSDIGGSLLGELGEGLGIGFLKPPRSIGTVIPECVIEEDARDDMEITRHPIESGASITDHAFKHPSEVVVRAGWSDSGSLPGYSKRAYEALLALQAKREPFMLMTGKKSYPNMLIASISQQTSSRTEHALMATIVLRQVVIVKSTTTTVAPAENHAAPQATAPTQDGGSRQAAAATPAAAATTPAAGPLTAAGSFLSDLYKRVF